MTKSIKNIIFTGLLLAFSVQAQDVQTRRLNEAARIVAKGGPVAPAQPVVAPKALVKAASVTLKPETPSFWAGIWGATKSSFSQLGEKAWNYLAKKPVKNTAVIAGVGFAATIYFMQKYKQSWMDQIEARIKEPNISQTPIVEDRKKNFYWAKWCTQRHASSCKPYAVPSEIGENPNQGLVLLNNMFTDIEDQRAFVFTIQNNKLDRRTCIQPNAIKNGDRFMRTGLGFLTDSIACEQEILRQDLIRLSGELVIDETYLKQTYNCLRYLKNIFTSNTIKTQIEVETLLYNVFNDGYQIYDSPEFINKLDDLWQLAQADLNNKARFIGNFPSLLYSKRAAGLYFDVAVAYGRLAAIKRKIQAVSEDNNQTI